MKSKTLLLTPGPTEVPFEVLERIGEGLVHHRSPEFRAVWGRVNGLLGQVFMTESPVLTLASSGTGALEAAIVNLFSPQDKVLVFSAGKWGERFGDVAAALGLETVRIETPYGEPVDPAAVRKGLAEHPSARGVLLALCETSTGVRHPVREIAAITRNSEALLLVDAVSGLGCEPFRMDEWGVDAAIAASQKGLMVPPGLGFVALGPRARAAMAQSRLPKFYFDLSKALREHARNDSPFTPAVSLILALDTALAMICEEGIENVWSRHARTADFARRSLELWGLEIFPKSAPSDALTAFRSPAGSQSGDILERMMRLGVKMADGQGELKGRIIRFAHMGYTARWECAARGLDALGAALEGTGFLGSRWHAASEWHGTTVFNGALS